jgi:sterol desaturase/sphingolipid hydroxylase (fatty acid hydroxylase superfamily)
MLHSLLGQTLFSIIVLLVALAIQAMFFIPLAFLCPADRKQPVFRRDMATDLAYIFFAVLIIEPLNSIFLALVYPHLYHPGFFNPYRSGAPAPHGMVLFLYLFVSIALVDLAQYWVHRALLHSRKLWKVHAIHHCSVNVDWLSNARAHPINYVLLNTMVFDLLGFAGFTPGQSIWGVAFYMFNSNLIHANLNWTYGPLRHVITSPVFHRWHHTAYEKGGDKNFATVFSFYDHLFGTFYMPKGEQPRDFGTPDLVSNSFWEQLAHPFRRRRAS